MPRWGSTVKLVQAVELAAQSRSQAVVATRTATEVRSQQRVALRQGLGLVVRPASQAVQQELVQQGLEVLRLSLVDLARLQRTGLEELRL
jgi:hypothetical protein